MINTRFNTDHIACMPRAIVGSLTAVLVVIAIQVPPCLAGDDALPKAETIIEKNIEATGGRAAYEKLHNRVTKGTFSIPGMGAAAQMTSYAAAPCKQYTIIESPALGKIEQGTDGDTVWEMTTVMGPTIKEGAERDFMLRASMFHGATKWKELYKTWECVGIEEVDGKPCYKVVMTPKEGHPDINYIDKETFLVAKTESKLDTMMGTLSLIIVGSDLRRVDGILIPHKVVQEIVGLQKITSITESIKHNVEMAADRFKLPADVQELVKTDEPKKKKADSKE